MAAYKAEFLSHHYARRLRPRTAYFFGLVFVWARLGSHFPRLANLVTQSAGLSLAMKAVAGVAPQRSIPTLAGETFQSWFRRRGAPKAVGRPVVLWPDTFNNYFTPGVAQAGVEVLEAAGFSPLVPIKPLCCGRPLYDYGMLRLARWKLRQVLIELAPYISAGVPIVGLEPSCVAVFRDELLNLFPDDPNAQALARQTFLLGEFLTVQGFEPPRLARKVLLHGHCHQKALSGMHGDLELLGKMDADVHLVDSGCCGMAGGFGYEKSHYGLSVKAGELALLPAVRDADTKTLIVADGFSCRSQISQGAGRLAMHLAEILQVSLRAH